MRRTLSYSLILVAVAAAAYLAGSWRAPRDTVSAAANDVPQAVLHYRCPMHPDRTSNTPGTTPCCGMDFEPVYADTASAEAATASAGSSQTIVVNASQQQLMGVTTGLVEVSSGIDRVRAFGRVIPDETRVYSMTAGLEAYVSDVSAMTTGSRVSRHQWLASYATPDARLPVSAFITSVNVLEREKTNGNPDSVSLAAARTSVTLATERLLTMGMSPVQIEDIRRTRAATTIVQLSSPVDGFVLARNVSYGQRFDAGTELFQVADLRRVWILADVPAADADRIGRGAIARVIIGGRDSGVRARASTTVPPQFDATSQSFKVRLEADNAAFVLRPDMFVDVEVEVPYRSSLTVPADAVVVSGMRRHVFVEIAAGIFEPRDVETGRRHGGRIAILAGLAAGERIALSGTFLLDSESRMTRDDRPHH